MYQIPCDREGRQCRVRKKKVATEEKQVSSRWCLYNWLQLCITAASLGMGDPHRKFQINLNLIFATGNQIMCTDTQPGISQ